MYDDVIGTGGASMPYAGNALLQEKMAPYADVKGASRARGARGREQARGRETGARTLREESRSRRIAQHHAAGTVLTPMSTPSVGQQLADRQRQEETLRAFFEANPGVKWQQTTLAEACGADVGAVRTRISVLSALWTRRRLLRSGDRELRRCPERSGTVAGGSLPRCTKALATWLRGEPKTASERWRYAEDGPPFIGLIFDEPTVRCLDAGVVNARAQVAAHEALAADDAPTMKAKASA